MRFLLLTEAEQHEAWQLIEAWGYPHERSKYPSVIMIEIGKPPAAYTWFEVMDEGVFLMHMAAKPSERGKWLTHNTIKKLYTAVELLGAHKVYVVTSDEYVNHLAAKFGFQSDEIGWYLEI